MRIHPDIKPVVDQAVRHLGFTVDKDLSGSGHVVLVHEGGTKYTVANSPSDWRGSKNALAMLEKIAGKKVERVNHRKSRKSVKGTDFTFDAVRKEQENWHRAWGQRVEQLHQEHNDLITEFRAIAISGQSASRTEINRAIEIVRRISEVETVLKEFNQPVETFNPTDVFS